MKNLFNEKALKNIYFLAALFSVLLLSTKQSKSQTTLAVGDLAFTGYNSDGNDSFSIILLTDIANNTVINFTDDGWNGSAFSGAEGQIAYTNNTGATITAKTQITIRGTGTPVAVFSGSSTSAGSITLTSGALSPSSGGDQIFAYQGTHGSPTIIAAVHMNVEASGYAGPGGGGTLTTNTTNWDGGVGGSDESALTGTGLTNGTNCVWLHDSPNSGPWEIDNARLKASELSAVISGTVAQIRTVCNDATKWDYDGSSDYNPCAPVVSSTPSNTTWNGSTWSNSAPTASVDAIIASSTTPGAFTCKDLTINSGVALTLGSGVTATVNGNLTNSGNGTSGVGTLRFEATGALSGNSFTHSGAVEVATGATLTTNNLLTIGNGGSLMHGTSTPNGGGSITGNITIEKTIGSTTDGWRTFGLPVDALVEDFETGLNTRCSNSTPSARQNVYYWDGTNAGSNIATGWVVANNTTDDENKGYSIYLSNNSSGFFDFSSTVSITGAPNDGTKTFNLDYTYDPEGNHISATQRGWNLIPNYFPSNLRVYDLINDGDFGSTYKAIHIWDQGSSQMVGINQSTMNTYNNSGTSVFSTTRQIPPFMAFWVKATSTSQSVQVKNSMRTSSTDSLPANTYFKNSPDIFRIEVKDEDGFNDQFTTAFVDEATHQFDNTIDIYKFKSFSDEVPTLYTKVDGEMVSLSAMPIETSYSVPVYMESYKDGKKYTVKAITAEYSNYYDVELVDNKTGASTKITEDDYSFNYDAKFTNARFTLNFSKKATTGIDELYSQEKSWAYNQNNAINVVYQNNNQAAVAQVEIYNTLGQKLFSQTNIKGGQTVSYTPSALNTQVYIIKVLSNGKANTIKVVY